MGFGTQLLGAGALAFGFQASLFGRVGGLGGAARLLGRGHAVDPFMQAGKGVKPVLFLRAVALGFEDKDAFGGNPAVGQRQQALLDIVGQAGGRHVKAQVDCAGDLVDVLAARALRPDGADLDLRLVNSDHWAHKKPPGAVKLDTARINTAQEIIMAKGQQKTNKESKKPKKDTSPPKPLASGEAPVRATITTTVIPRGKIKTK